MAGPLAFAPLGGGLFLGWTLGANDAANVFGPAVSTRILSYRMATLLCGGMVILGAVLQGGAGIETLSGLTNQTLATAVLVTMSAAITSMAMTMLGMPISTSQAVVGAILGIGLATNDTNFGGLIKVLICWVATPIGSMLIAIPVFKGLSFILRRGRIGLFTRDTLLRTGLVGVGMYGSYALGANNVANTTGIFSGRLPGMDDTLLAAIGGVAIAAGAITCSHRVMVRVGGLMRLDAFTALVAVSSMSICVHVFAMVGVPVSTSQGIVGAIVGVGFIRGAHVVNYQTLLRIGMAWFVTPFAALILSAAGYAIFLL